MESTGEERKTVRRETPAARRMKLLREFQSLPDANPDQPEAEAWIELENEADATNSELSLEKCWLRSAHAMPTLRIITEFEVFLIPWFHVIMVKSDRSCRVITLYISSGMTFEIAAEFPLKVLVGMLQLERVRVIYPAPGVTVKAVMPPVGHGDL